MSTSPNPLSTAFPGAGTSYAVHSPDVAQVLIQHTAVPLTAAQLIAMGTTPVTVLPAPYAGLAYLVHKIMLSMTTTSTAFTGGGTVVVQYHTGTVAMINTIPAAVVTATAGTTDTLRIGKDV